MGMTIEEYESSDLMAENEFLRKQLAEALKHRRMFEADYENRLKADMIAMLEDLRQDLIAEASGIAMDCTVFVVNVADIDKVIQQRINELKGDQEGENDR